MSVGVVVTIELPISYWGFDREESVKRVMYEYGRGVKIVKIEEIDFSKYKRNRYKTRKTRCKK